MHCTASHFRAHVHKHTDTQVMSLFFFALDRSSRRTRDASIWRNDDDKGNRRILLRVTPPAHSPFCYSLLLCSGKRRLRPIGVLVAEGGTSGLYPCLPISACTCIHPRVLFGRSLCTGGTGQTRRRGGETDSRLPHRHY